VTLVGAILLFALVRLAGFLLVAMASDRAARPSAPSRRGSPPEPLQWMFAAARSDLRPATLVDFVEDRDMVVAVEIGGDAVAWPVRQMAYHHIVEDKVGGVPVVSTY
jgi:hypothetical protein